MENTHSTSMPFRERVDDDDDDAPLLLLLWCCCIMARLPLCRSLSFFDVKMTDELVQVEKQQQSQD